MLQDKPFYRQRDKFFYPHPIQFFLVLTRPFSSSFSPIFSTHTSSSGQLLWDLRSAIWKLRGSFFLPLFQPISALRGLTGKNRLTVKKQEKPSIYAGLHEVFSALKAFLGRFGLWFASAFRVVSALILQGFFRHKKRPCKCRLLYKCKVLFFLTFPRSIFFRSR